ncbi:hypothetical protein OTK49_21550 [Vibrio coralliirubri]|uniref:hypothetical protein n=1 Tax=Vibrio coralliirubri TaxID=1516159 RepID=UPI002284A34C|nr:hypothetical protein [Vibrio coralliirubri]MCY9865108.1 hypothetical protein [Vibrio coralliirubri]
MKHHHTETPNMNMADTLVNKGLKLVDSHDTGAELEADHTFEELHQVFKENNWRLTYNGSVGKGVHQAAFEASMFGGGRAVLHFKKDKVHYLTLNYSRNYFD